MTKRALTALLLRGVAIVLAAGTGAWLGTWAYIELLLGHPTDGAKLLSALKDATQTIAVVIGGVWTYRIFISQRLGRVRVDLSHKVEHELISPSLRLVRVVVEIKNIGQVLFKPFKGGTAIYQVAPPKVEFLAALKKGERPYDPLKPHETWPRLFDSQMEFASDNLEIEPGETERYIVDFIIPVSVEGVQAHSKVFMDDRDGSDYWDETSLHRLPWRALSPNYALQQSGAICVRWDA